MKEMVLKLLEAVPGPLREYLLGKRSLLVYVVQLSLIFLANLLAFSLRFEGAIPEEYWILAFQSLPLVGLVYWTSLLAFGVHKGLWRYVDLHDLNRIGLSIFSGTLILFFILHVVLGWAQYPRSVIILTGILATGFLGGVRLIVRWLREWLQIVGPAARRVLIVGAGSAGELLVRDMLANPKYNCRPVGFVDDDPVKHGLKIHGILVFGAVSDIPTIVQRCQPHEMIVAIPSGSPEFKQRVLSVSRDCKIPIKTVSSLRQRINDGGSLQRVRPMSLEDLLQRDPVKTDLKELHPLIEGRKVLVTGAGGSIGSELCRQVASYRPLLLILFERHENSLYAMDKELRGAFPHLKVLPIIGDVTSQSRVQEVFKAHAPHLVFHAAAHKHVPLMEDNPGEAVRNNIGGTQILGEASLDVGVDQFVLISTDKAINPVSVMGMTKRIAECLVQGWNRRGLTRFTAVRFGNVLGSNGSVVPLFKEQIEKGGPVTVTHPDVTRYFMTIPEAVQLVLQSSVMSEGGDIFVLDMGKPIRVADLAKNMIVLSGLVPDQDIEILFTGLRPGEKLYEELFDKQELVGPTGHSKINRAAGRLCQEGIELLQPLAELQSMLDTSESEAIVHKLREIVIGQTHTTVESK